MSLQFRVVYWFAAGVLGTVILAVLLEWGVPLLVALVPAIAFGLVAGDQTKNVWAWLYKK